MYIPFLYPLFVLAVTFSGAPAQSSEPHVLKPLQVGDTVPAGIDLGFFDGSGTPFRIDDYRGKVVILDCWATTCGACIKAFPYMERLKAQFGDRIEIILVNAKQTREEVSQSLLRQGLEGMEALSSLPSISAAETLGRLFPHRLLPHHIWIDGQGVVRVIGNPKNTHTVKIQQLLDGQEISYMKNSNNTVPYDRAEPYAFRSVGDLPMPPYHLSHFSGFNGDVSPFGRVAEGIIDSITNTVRYTYVNMDPFYLYIEVTRPMVADEWETQVAGPNPILPRPYLDATRKRLPDGALGMLGLPPYGPHYRTDDEWVANHFCYEYMGSMEMDGKERAASMLVELNRYLRSVYRCHVSVETIQLDCFEIGRKESEGGKPGDRGGDGWQGRLRSGLRSGLSALYEANGQIQPYIFLTPDLAEVGMAIVCPVWEPHHGLADFGAMLERHGLEIRRTVKPIPVLVFNAID